MRGIVAGVGCMPLLDGGESVFSYSSYLFLGDIYPVNIKPMYATTMRGIATRKVIISTPEGRSIKLLARKSACETRSSHKAARLFPIRLISPPYQNQNPSPIHCPNTLVETMHFSARL
jgi:hypothetical protein